MAELCNKRGKSKYCKLPSDIIYSRILYSPLEVKGLFATSQSDKDPLIPTVIYRSLNQASRLSSDFHTVFLY